MKEKAHKSWEAKANFQIYLIRGKLQSVRCLLLRPIHVYIIEQATTWYELQRNIP